MVKQTTTLCPWTTMAELIDYIGGIAPERIYLRPPPGKATEQDVKAIRATIERRLCELIDGVLVEIAYGFRESALEVVLSSTLLNYSPIRKRGVVLGASMAYRLRPGCVRRPCISVVLWNRFPGRKLPEEEIPDLAPDLAIHVLRVGNTEREMQRALQDYFAAGVQRVWLIDPRTETAEDYTSPTMHRHFDKNEAIDGGDILPGFSLSLEEPFDWLQAH